MKRERKEGEQLKMTSKDTGCWKNKQRLNQHGDQREKRATGKRSCMCITEMEAAGTTLSQKGEENKSRQDS